MINTTLISSLHCDGTARLGTADTDGTALTAARRRKERTYPELVGTRGRARLVVSAGEVGGRWSAETMSFLSQLTKAKTRHEPHILRQRVQQAWRSRWQAILSCAAAKPFAMSLLKMRAAVGADGDTPASHDVLRDFQGPCRVGLSAFVFSDGVFQLSRFCFVLFVKKKGGDETSSPSQPKFFDDPDVLFGPSGPPEPSWTSWTARSTWPTTRMASSSITCR